ncbi:hypothetical protein UFOVP1254_68 [uncultured Caudovirales phage]|uniref:Uncharacterized protein n=1 Tax=uncultured Caudovirales phage TaxID=2100421 RepID=A0A6J5RQ47_9CAUD|nr:hypothetical protein UFOVP1254_68 [uncultured Caudovirales phage]
MPINEQQSFLRQLAYHLSMGMACEPKQTPLTPLRLATDHLEAAELDLLRHQHLAEFHNGTVETLKKRIARLRLDIAALAAAKKENT